MLKHSRLSPSKRLAKDGEGVFWSVTPTWNAGGGGRIICQRRIFSGGRCLES